MHTHLLSSAERLASSSRPELFEMEKQAGIERISFERRRIERDDVNSDGLLTERLLELLGVYYSGSGLAAAKDAFVETRVEGRVGARVVG